MNWTLLSDLPVSLDGLLHDVEHVTSGHDIVVRGHHYWFMFHFLNSLGPGMTWPALILTMGGLAAALWAWPRAEFRDRWMLAAALVFYLAVEIPPLKPWPTIPGTRSRWCPS